MAKNKSKKPKKPTGYNPLAPVAKPQQYATSYVQKQVKPALSNLTQQAAIKGAADAKAITDLTTALADHMAKAAPAVQANYGQAQQSQAALDENLHNALANSGQSVNTGLSSKLAQMGAPTAAANATTGAVTQNAGGAANAGLAKGSASLSQLLAQGANQTAYAQTLPSYAAGLGQQNLASNQTRNNANLASQTASLNAQIPTLVANVLNETLSRNYQIASGNRSAKQAAAANAAINSFKTGSQVTSQKNANTSRANSRISQQNANTSVQNANTSAGRARTTANKVTIKVDGKGRYFKVDNKGNWIGYVKDANGNIKHEKKTSSKSSSASASNPLAP